MNDNERQLKIQSLKQQRDILCDAIHARNDDIGLACLVDQMIEVDNKIAHLRDDEER